ncbi:hypothetical protein D5086_030269 [Populus alba]|uniref:Uncharacterized protein n=1 Tax=Populus alba TaxID=43335 RepID=A0ACC4API1_POPAL
MDGSSSGGGNGYRVEAERWLTISEKLLAARDLHGLKSFAIRARESDPRLYEFSDQIIAVADTLLAGELRVENNHHYDYYMILQLGRLTQDLELIADQYRKLALLLNPTRNRLLFADQAFKLVSEAWLVLSNPAKKAMYDHELQLSQLGLLVTQQPPPPPFQQQPPSNPEPIRPVPQFTPKPSATDSRQAMKHATTFTAAAATGTKHANASEPELSSFWTACPYCYILYEYPKAYEECILRCQSCRRAFHAVMVPAPPVTGKDTYFCCWGFFPLGFSGNNEKGGNEFGSNWSPFSAMFSTPFPAGGAVGSGGQMYNKVKQKVIYKDDVYIDISDTSEDESDSGDEWGGLEQKNIQNDDGDGGGSVPEEVVEKGKELGKGRQQKILGKLDLNVMFSNEVDEAAPGPSQRNGPGHGEEDNIEGIGFLRVFDEFLSTLPILSVVGE